MRTLRLSLAGTVILGLLGGLSVSAVVGQSDEDGSSTWTYVTGKIIEEGQGHTQDAPIVETTGWEVEWSDPRLPSLMEANHRMAGLGYMGTYRLEGPDGAWTGTGLGFIVPDPVIGRQFHEAVALIGEGAYEGLSAWLARKAIAEDTGGEDDVIFEGYILEPVWEMPSMPDPVEPFVESAD